MDYILTLPVADICADLVSQLQQQPVVLLTAPPGAGKSTYLPLYLLRHPAFANQRIIMLEPRRLAAKSIAAYLAAQLHEAVGQTVGYQIRLEQQCSASTRLLIVTEGVLIRKIQQDPALSSVDLLIFDEFHQRTLQADLALALALEVRQLNEQLRLLIMSATLAGAELSEKLQAPLLVSEGRQYPVEVRYQAPTQEEPWQQSARLAAQLLTEHDGSFLVFLPGQREIERAYQWLLAQLPPQVLLYPLLGTLPLAEQQQAIAPAPAGKRKIVLSTNVAETSLTIDGISVVIDSGLARQASYQPRLGFSKLDTVAISQAAAVQRAGRAGRLQAGFCYRIDTAEKWTRRPAFDCAEIQRTDLLGLRLEIAGWGCQVADLFWLDPPPAAQLAAAEQCLIWLGALSAGEQGAKLQLTARGKAMLQLGTDPRLAAMLLAGKDFEQQGFAGAQALAVLLVCHLEQNKRSQSCDILRQMAQHRSSALMPQARQLMRQLKADAAALQGPLPEQLTAALLAQAFPDRIAQQRGQGYLLASGTGAVLPANDELAHSPYLVVADLRLLGKDACISTAIAYSASDLQSQWQAQLSQQRYFAFDEENGRFIAEQRLQLGALVLKRQNISQGLTAADRQQAWLDWLAKRGIDALPWSESARNLQQRLLLAAWLQPDAGWPDCRDPALQATAADWLGPALGDISQLGQLQKLDIKTLLWQRLNYQQQQKLNHWLPASWRSVLGTETALHYSGFEQAATGQISLAIRLQEMFGQSVTPTVADGRMAVTVSLLSPSRQPLQLTRDLASFWQNAYQDVKKEMKGRYPKHYWPDDPLQAMPTNKTKKAMLK